MAHHAASDRSGDCRWVLSGSIAACAPTPIRPRASAAHSRRSSADNSRTSISTGSVAGPIAANARAAAERTIGLGWPSAVVNAATTSGRLDATAASASAAAHCRSQSSVSSAPITLSISGAAAGPISQIASHTDWPMSSKTLASCGNDSSTLPAIFHNAMAAAITRNASSERSASIRHGTAASALDPRSARALHMSRADPPPVRTMLHITGMCASGSMADISSGN